MYVTDRGIEECAHRRGEEGVGRDGSTGRQPTVIDLVPEFETPETAARPGSCGGTTTSEEM